MIILNRSSVIFCKLLIHFISQFLFRVNHFGTNQNRYSDDENGDNNVQYTVDEAKERQLLLIQGI